MKQREIVLQILLGEMIRNDRYLRVLNKDLYFAFIDFEKAFH